MKILLRGLVLVSFATLFCSEKKIVRPSPLAQSAQAQDFEKIKKHFLTHVSPEEQKEEETFFKEYKKKENRRNEIFQQEVFKCLTKISHKRVKGKPFIVKCAEALAGYKQEDALIVISYETVKDVLKKNPLDLKQCFELDDFTFSPSCSFKDSLTRKEETIHGKALVEEFQSHCEAFKTQLQANGQRIQYDPHAEINAIAALVHHTFSLCEQAFNEQKIKDLRKQ